MTLLKPPSLARGYNTIVPKCLVANQIPARLRRKIGKSAQIWYRPTCRSAESICSTKVGEDVLSVLAIEGNQFPILVV